MRPGDDGEFPPDPPPGWLAERAKRAIRRALLKAVAVPGRQVPFATTELPLPPGWGTGGMQVTAAVLGPADMLKVIDQGADDATNATSIRAFFARVSGVRTTTRTDRASVIQSRHRIPETRLRAGQILVMQVPQPEPMRRVSPHLDEAREAHALGDYGSLYVLLYESVARHGRVAISYDHPVLVNHRYVASPSPIPNFDVGKLDRCPALVLFGAGRERRLYAIPPHTSVAPLQFEDHRFVVQSWSAPCARCGDTASFRDVLIAADGARLHVCSDTDHCARRQAVPATTALAAGGE